MKHTVEELLAIAYEYFPRGMQTDDPRFPETPEAARQRAARVPASEHYDAWREMLERLRRRFPEEGCQGFSVEDRCPFLKVATVQPLLDQARDRNDVPRPRAHLA